MRAHFWYELRPAVFHVTAQIRPRGEKPQHSVNTDARRIYSRSERVQNFDETQTSLYIRFDFLFVKAKFFVLLELLLLQYNFNFLTNCMNFFPDQSTRRSGKLYSKISDPKMSASVQNPANTPATRGPKIAEEPINGVSKDLIEERIKANLDPLNTHLSTSTQLLNQLIQESSARDSPTADTCT